MPRNRIRNVINFANVCYLEYDSEQSVCIETILIQCFEYLLKGLLHFNIYS